MSDIPLEQQADQAIVLEGAVKDRVRNAVVEILTGYNTEIDNKLCLLYTSPSPRDYAASRMPSSA